MTIDRLIIKRFGNIESLTLKFKKGLNVIDCPNKREVAFAYCLAVGGGKFEDYLDKQLNGDVEITANFSDGIDKITVKITKSEKIITTSDVYTERYESVFTENSRRNTACYFFHEDGNTQDVESDLSVYKDEDFCLSDEYIRNYGVKAFRIALNIYLRSVKAEPINEDKSIYIGIRSDGRFTAVTCDGEKVEITGKEKTLFNYNCFLKNREFWQVVHQTKDINYPEIPLLITNFNGNIDGEKKDYLIKAALKNSEQVLAM